MDFDPEVYLFTGEVVGYAVDSSRVAGKYPEQREGEEEVHAAGVLVKPVLVVHIPQRAEVYSVFPVGCALVFEFLSAVQHRYHVGDTLAVTGYESKHLATTPSGKAPLAAHTYDGITRAGDIGGGSWLAVLSEDWNRTNSLPRAAGRVSTLQRWVELPKRDVPEGTLREMRSWSARFRFEFERDLYLLHQANGSEEAVGILRKLRRYWFRAEPAGREEAEDCYYTRFVDTHLSDPALRVRLEGWLLYAGLRPLPSLAGCEAKRAIRDELEQKRQQGAGG